MTVKVVVIIKPKPEHIDEGLQALKELAVSVEANEPGALEFEFYRQTNSEEGTESIVVIETYADLAAWDAHGKTESFQKLVKDVAEQGKLLSPPDFKILNLEGGFALRKPA